MWKLIDLFGREGLKLKNVPESVNKPQTDLKISICEKTKS